MFKHKLRTQLLLNGASSDMANTILNNVGIDDQVKENQTNYWSGLANWAANQKDMPGADWAIARLAQYNPQVVSAVRPALPTTNQIRQMIDSQNKTTQIMQAKQEAQRQGQLNKLAQIKATTEGQKELAGTKYGYDSLLEGQKHGQNLVEIAKQGNIDLAKLKTRGAIDYNNAANLTQLKAIVGQNIKNAEMAKRQKLAEEAISSGILTKEQATSYMLQGRYTQNGEGSEKMTAAEKSQGNRFTNMINNVMAAVRNRPPEETGDIVDEFYNAVEEAATDDKGHAIDPDTLSLLRNYEYYSQYIREYRAGNIATAKELFETMTPEFRASQGLTSVGDGA